MWCSGNPSALEGSFRTARSDECVSFSMRGQVVSQMDSVYQPFAARVGASNSCEFLIRKSVNGG